MDQIEWVKSKFREYYLKNRIILPPRFSNREYGFTQFGKEGMIRHIKFSSENEIMSFMIKNIPSHSYYSAAYYKKPDAQRMDEKEWLGADLIFDLDADHIVSGETTYENMLMIVKKETKKLIENFLLSDFGFDEKDLEIVFSGGRGYHIHVRNERIYSLKSDERRELVSYITASNMDFMDLINKIPEGDSKLKENYLLFPENYGGWYSKFSRSFNDAIKNLVDLYDSGKIQEIEKLLSDSGIKNKKRFLENLFLKKVGSEKRIADLILDQSNRKRLNYLDEKTREDLIKFVTNFSSINLKGETDEPVTTDIHRLIRLPGSLHGKTGFVVKPVDLKNFDEFDPLNDAIYSGFTNNFVRVIIKKPLTLKALGKVYNYNEGEDEMPEFLAIFSLLRGTVDLKLPDQQLQ